LGEGGPYGVCWLARLRRPGDSGTISNDIGHAGGGNRLALAALMSPRELVGDRTLVMVSWLRPVQPYVMGRREDVMTLFSAETSSVNDWIADLSLSHHKRSYEFVAATETRNSCGFHL
jgi:hypothetical protein